MTTSHGLSADQVAAYEESGFLAIEGFVPASTCADLRQRAGELLDDFDPEGIRSIFSTQEQSRTSDDYFLGSGYQVRFFFEEEAFDPSGGLKQDKELSINKIGHALHDLDPLFSRFSRSPALASVSQSIGQQDPRLIQSMYIFKQPRIGGEVVLHQDSTFLYTEPLSVVGFWFALEDATVDNGCLWAMPGGHRAGLKQRFRRAEAGGTEFLTLDEVPFPDIELVPLEVPKGTLVVLHGLLPHWSGPNRSDHSRHAYAVHVIEGGAHYPEDNWLHRSAPATGF